MDFQEYLHSKKIDSDAFKKANPTQWNEWETIFDRISPQSFTAQKLYLINPIRRQFPFLGVVEPKIKSAGQKKPVIKPKSKEENVEEATPVKAKVNPKPVMKPKPKMQAKPIIPAKPKIPTKQQGEGEAAKDESKPKFKPRPVIKKRPKTD